MKEINIDDLEIIRDKTYSTTPETIERVKVFKFKPTPDSEYVVDDSNFIPISEALKQLKGNSVSAGEIEQSYDFPNGKDNGMSIPVGRRTDIKDITEISTHIMEQTEKLSNELAKGREKAKRQAEYQKSIDSIIKSSGSSDIKTE